MGKRGFIFCLVFIFLFSFVFNGVFADNDPNYSPEYIPCLDESYGWMPSAYSYPEYYQRSYVGHEAVILHRKHVYCSNSEPYTLMYGLEEQYLVLHGERRDYCNYICRDRYHEQCILDGSFDTYYMEWCEDADGNVIEIEGSTYWEPTDLNCYSDRDCPFEEFCNSGHCLSEGNSTLECTSSFDCGSGEVCDAGQCVWSSGPECTCSGDCSEEQACVNGNCVGLECGYDEQCDEGEICENGACVDNVANVAKIDSEEEEKIKEEVFEDEKIAEPEIINSLEGCVDSDGGLNYYTQGVVKGDSGNTFRDYCDVNNINSENVLIEYLCGFEDGHEVKIEETHFCLDKCEEGACIKGENECTGCFVDNKCLFVGYRKSGDFCSEEKVFVEQLGEETSCDNNFECNSNLCVGGKCISQGLIDKLFNWFKRLF